MGEKRVSMFAGLRGDVAKAPILWGIWGGLTLMAQAVGVIATKAVNVSQWWSVLFALGTLATAVSWTMLWLRKDRIRETLRREDEQIDQDRRFLAELLSLRDSAAHLLKTANTKERAYISRLAWPQAHDSMLNEAQRLGGSESPLPRDVAFLILNPESLPPLESYAGENPTTSDTFYQIAAMRRGAEEAAERFAGQRGLPFQRATR